MRPFTLVPLLTFGSRSVQIGNYVKRRKVRRIASIENLNDSADRFVDVLRCDTGATFVAGHPSSLKLKILIECRNSGEFLKTRSIELVFDKYTGAVLYSSRKYPWPHGHELSFSGWRSA
ncbi:uncharacterized protein LACBIDRAFT_329439 [Laccaria bicolor S238N-H82]|uniref:Predicted protein n=1 Tax=Laccaria bicolor (strain S238N-H82 / ATCC MYA-4686) TaxID=486041 RepID=B0DI07_LACBS|nr:uncharacterized protein LACBIDRAFT_329439 [Laccaria bicolor S238N-H82]EDR05822.1 predicted protein [Laccaria bicolor S238N-H82]|eukprot:XP_001883498.1 predicted protein [Laccaria bicolor S238N-H82]